MTTISVDAKSNGNGLSQCSASLISAIYPKDTKGHMFATVAGNGDECEGMNQMPTEVLSDDALREIEARAELASSGPWMITDGQHIDQYAPHPEGNRLLSEGAYDANYHMFGQNDVEFIAHAREDIPALCATVRALREKYDSLKSRIAWHRDGIGPDVPVLQERYDRLMAQRTALTTGLANIYHVVTNEECDRAVALGMATSAVSSLLNQNTALREQLAQVENEREILRADLKYRYEVIEELRRCRDRWFTMLNPANPEETVDGAIRALQSQLAQVTQERDELLTILHAANLQ